MRHIKITESSGGTFGWNEVFDDGYEYHSTFSMTAGEVADALETLLLEREKLTITFE